MGGTTGLNSPPYPHALVHKCLTSPEMGASSLGWSYCPGALPSFSSPTCNPTTELTKLTLLLSVKFIFFEFMRQKTPKAIGLEWL